MLKFNKGEMNNMKKKFYLLGIMILCIIPNMVRAEIKEVNGKSYLIETGITFSCPIASTPVFLESYNNKAVLWDTTSDDLYLYDFKTDSCALMTNEEINQSNIDERKNSKAIDYEWDNSNKLYEISTHSYYVKYLKTTDSSIENDKTYYIKGSFSESDGQLYVEVDNPVLGELSNYYEQKYIIETSSLTIDTNKKYYTTFPDNSIVEVEDPKAQDILSYYIIIDETELSATKYLMNLDSSKFNFNPIVNTTLTKNDLYRIINLNGKKYFLFLDPFFGHLYDINGTYMNSKFVKNGSKIYSDHINVVSDHLVVYNGVSNSSSRYMEILDSDFNSIISINRDHNSYSNKLSVYDNVAIIFTLDMDTNEKSFIKVTTYTNLENSSKTYNNNDLTLTFSGELSKLNSVKVGDTVLDDSYYTKSSGSTIITLKKDYLKTLNPGAYTLKVEYNDGGYASATFTIPEENPQTLDGIIYFVSLGIISLIGIVSCKALSNKRKRFN